MNRQFLALAGLSLWLCACSSIQDTRQQPIAAEPPQAPQVAEVPTRPFPPDTFEDLLVAEFAVRRDRFDLALGNYMQQAHETRDPAVTARATRIAQYLKADNAALDGATLWTEIEPDNLEGQFTLSSMLAKQGKPLQALQPMTTVLEKGGETNFAMIAASALSMDDKQRNELEIAFDKLIERHPNNTQLLISKALLLQQRGEGENALKHIRRALKIEPQNLHAIVTEARLLHQMDRPNEAFARLEKVVSQYPDNRRLRLQYARMLMSKDMDAAKQQFEWLLSTTPGDPDLLMSLGLISNEIGDTDDARSYFKQLLETGQRDLEAHFYLGQMEEQQQNWGQALYHYQQIPPGKDYITALSRITAIYIAQGRLEVAQQNLQQNRVQHPELALKLYLLEAEVLNKGQRYQDGQQLMSEALLLFPNEANLLYTRAMFNEKLERYDRMEKDLRNIIAQEPDNAVALNALGYVMINQSDRIEEAYQMIKRALELKPGDPAILDSLGWAEYRRGNLAQAVQLLSQAYEIFPDHEVAAHLGEVLWQIGEKKQALEIWRQGLMRTPDSRYILDTLKRFGVALPSPQARAEESSDTSAP